MTVFILNYGVVTNTVGYAAEKAATEQKKTEKPTVKEPEPAALIEKAMVSKQATENLQKKYYYDSKGKPDPMYIPWRVQGEVTGKQSGAPGATGVDIVLPETVGAQVCGVVWSPKDPVALVGDKIVHEGDEITSAKVVKINKGEVIFLYGGKTFPVKVGTTLTSF